MVPFEDVLSAGSSVPSLFLIGFNLPSLLRQSRQRAATKRRGGRRAPEGFRAGPEPPLSCGRARAAAELPPLNSPPRIAAPKPRGVRLKPRESSADADPVPVLDPVFKSSAAMAEEGVVVQNDGAAQETAVSTLAGEKRPREEIRREDYPSKNAYKKVRCQSVHSFNRQLWGGGDADSTAL